MKMLSQNEMMELNGGDLCKVEGFITLLACSTGLLIACFIGGAGYLFLC